MNIILNSKAHLNIGDNFAEVSKYVNKYIGDTGYGTRKIGSRFSILDDKGKLLAYVSYNGRIWHKSTPPTSSNTKYLLQESVR